MGLREVVVRFHVGGEEGNAVEAVVDAGVPGLETDAGHGAVGEELGVGGVLLDAVGGLDTGLKEKIERDVYALPYSTSALL